MTTEHKSWLTSLLEKYNALCKDLGVDAGACRGCVPVVKFDPEKEKTQSLNENPDKR